MIQCKSRIKNRFIGAVVHSLWRAETITAQLLQTMFYSEGLQSLKFNVVLFVKFLNINL